MNCRRRTHLALFQKLSLSETPSAGISVTIPIFLMVQLPGSLVVTVSIIYLQRQLRLELSLLREAGGLRQWTVGFSYDLGRIASAIAA